MSASVIDPKSGLPIGPEIPAHPAPRPRREVLEGRYVRLEPLDPDAHGAALWQATHGDSRHALWQYLFDAPFADEAAYRLHLTRQAASADPFFFAIVDRTSGLAVGSQALMRIDPNHRTIEIGSIIYGPELQRTPGGTEAQFLPMRYAFDDLGYRRYEWKCNALNAPSRQAASRYGFTFEGIFRQHMIIRGRNRDTAWFSIIEPEWPRVKEAFVRWLDPANFDAAGKQRASLTSIRDSL